MGPKRLLWDRSNMWRAESLHNSEGMVPLKWLDRRRKIDNDGMLSPIQAGMLPESWFSPRSRLSISEQFFSEGGISPERWLLESTKNLIVRREPIDSGISPEKLLFVISRIYREDMFFKNWGIPPDKLLLEMTNVSNCFRLPTDWGMLPFIELKEISKSVRNGGFLV